MMTPHPFQGGDFSQSGFLLLGPDLGIFGFHLLHLGQIALGGFHGQALGNQVVPGIAPGHIRHGAQRPQGGNVFRQNDLQLLIPPQASSGCRCSRRKSSHKSSTPRVIIKKNSGFKNING